MESVRKGEVVIIMKSYQTLEYTQKEYFEKIVGRKIRQNEQLKVVMSDTIEFYRGTKRVGRVCDYKTNSSVIYGLSYENTWHIENKNALSTEFEFEEIKDTELGLKKQFQKIIKRFMVEEIGKKYELRIQEEVIGQYVKWYMDIYVNGEKVYLENKNGIKMQSVVNGRCEQERYFYVLEIILPTDMEGDQRCLAIRNNLQQELDEIKKRILMAKKNLYSQVKKKRIGIAMIVIYAYILTLLFYFAWGLYFYAYICDEVVAEVVSVQSDIGHRGRRFYRTNISYQYKGDEYYNREDTRVKVEAGEKISIYVNPSNPNDVMFVDNYKLGNFWILIGIILLMAVVYYDYKKNRKKYRYKK